MKEYFPCVSASRAVNFTRKERGGMEQSEWKKQRVVDLLAALVAGRREELLSYLSPACRIVFPGFSAVGVEGVAALFTMIEDAFDGCPTKTYDLWVIDDRAAVVSGTLQGKFRDGRIMDGTRYTDQFFFDGEGRVTDWLVWNDLALLPPA